jgi:hypothetical protein
VTAKPKLAVAHFDQPSLGDSGVIPLASRGSLTRLRLSLRVPHGAQGGSDLSPALDQIERLMSQHPGEEYRLTVFSDFALTDPDPAEVYDRLRDFPGQVYAAVLQADPPAALTGANITATVIGHDDPPGTLAAVLHQSITASRPGRRHSTRHTTASDTTKE